MKKNITSIIYLISLMMMTQHSFCQSEKFDIINYTSPANWTKDTKKSYVSYITVNETAGTFCLIVLYAAVPGTGTPETDFAKEWDELVVKPYNAAPNPKTEMRTNTDGWKVVAGAAQVQTNNISSFIILSVFSGFDKTISVLANLNSDAYTPEIDKFLENMKPDKPVSNNPVVPTNNQTTVPGKYGQLIYTTPPGWEITNLQNAVALSPADLPEGEYLDIRIFQPMKFTGSLEQALEKSYDEVCSMLQVTKMLEVSGKHYDAKEVKKSFKGWEYIRCSGGIQVNNGAPYPDEYGLELFVIKVSNRFERIAIAKSRNTCNGLSRYYPSDRLSASNAIEDFLFSIRFDDWKEPVVAAGVAKGTGIIGVWQGFSLSVGLAKPGAESGAELTTKNLILFSNGQVFFGKNFPLEGLDGLNTWIKAENNRRDWGTYSFNNGRGVLKMPYGDIPLRMENNKLIVTTNKTDHGFIKLNPVDDAEFNGTYTLGESNERILSITFTPDRRFIDNGAIRVLYHEYIDCLNPAIRHGSGTYAVKNNTVIFKYTDGRIIRIAFPGMDFNKNSSNPTLRLSFNDDVLKKQ